MPVCRSLRPTAPPTVPPFVRPFTQIASFILRRFGKSLRPLIRPRYHFCSLNCHEKGGDLGQGIKPCILPRYPFCSLNCHEKGGDLGQRSARISYRRNMTTCDAQPDFDESLSKISPGVDTFCRPLALAIRQSVAFCRCSAGSNHLTAIGRQ